MAKNKWLTRTAAVILPIILIGQAGLAQTGATKKVFRWGRFEAQFTSSADYENPLQDLRVEVDFTAPSGKTRTVEAFWDGARNWKVRLAPEEAGKWTYKSRSSKADDAGLNGGTGSFDCVAARLRSRWIASSPVSPRTGSIPRPGCALRSAESRTRGLTSSRRREAGIGFYC